MTYPDVLEELDRTTQIVIVEDFNGNQETNDSVLSNKLSKRTEIFGSATTIRVELATLKLLRNHGKAWELAQDMSAHDEFNDLVQKDIFQHGVKTVAKYEPSAPYWLLKRLAYFKAENGKKADQDEVMDISFTLELAINMAHWFSLKVIKEIPNLENPMKKIWRLINDILATTYHDEELIQNVATKLMNHDLLA